MRVVRDRFQWWVPAVVVGVLGGMVYWQHSLPDGSVGQAYRDGIKARFANYPTIVGGGSSEGSWEGTDREIPKEAMALLHLNFYLSRQYVNRMQGWRVGLLLEEAEESRDMMGHYPPNCYPGDGWVLVSATAAKDGAWVLGDMKIKGTEYEFKREVEGRERHLWVRNFFALPNDTFYGDIASFGRAASDFSIRPYGAMQVQVIYDQEYLPEDRERIFQSLMRAHMDLLEAMRKRN